VTGRRVVRALDLVDDEHLIDAYRSRHAPGAVWPEVIEHIHATGVLGMEIWCTRNRLIMVMEVSEDFPRKVTECAQVAAWERQMEEFQQRIPGAPLAEKWTEMTRIFALDESNVMS
jgi:L-rhamnose mutarotase